MNNINQNIVKSHFIASKADGLLAWLQRKTSSDSLWPTIFGESCCSLEYNQSHLDDGPQQLDFDYFPPKICDLLIISGPINRNMLPELLLAYDEMKSPKWVMAIGACTKNGGPFSETYNIVSNLESYIPIDIYIPGCPPSTNAIIEGIKTLRTCLKEGHFQHG